MHPMSPFTRWCRRSIAQPRVGNFGRGVRNHERIDRNHEQSICCHERRMRNYVRRVRVASSTCSTLRRQKFIDSRFAPTYWKIDERKNRTIFYYLSIRSMRWRYIRKQFRKPTSHHRPLRAAPPPSFVPPRSSSREVRGRPSS